MRPLPPSIYASIGFVKGTRPFVSSDQHETSHSSSSGRKLGGALSIAKWATSNDHCAFIFGKKEMRLGDFNPGRELSARAEALSFRLLIGPDSLRPWKRSLGGPGWYFGHSRSCSSKTVSSLCSLQMS